MNKYVMTLLLLAAGSVQAQDGAKRIETLVVRTSTVCDMCVNTIEDNVIYEKGVKKVRVDLSANTVTVDYDPRKTAPDAIRQSIVKLGYMADEVPGDPKAFAKLPACCQKEGCGQVPEQR